MSMLRCALSAFRRHRRSVIGLALAVGLLGLFATTFAEEIRHTWMSGIDWPKPRAVDPGPVGGPPSDAVVLFDGKDLSQWNGGDRWLVKDGVATARRCSITSKKSFGDCQLHVEWASPAVYKNRKGQRRGNSGIKMMGLYEIQILDSYKNDTYRDGQAGAIYKQSAPMVNASRKSGEWQSYDIIFHAPRFAKDGTVVKPGTITVLHNGVLIQDHHILAGTTTGWNPPVYEPHPPKLPIKIQFHGTPVRFRNIWVRDIKPLPKPLSVEGKQSRATILGTVYLDRKRIKPVKITLYAEKSDDVFSATTDESSSFKLKCLPPGLYKVTIEPTDKSNNSIPTVYSTRKTTPLSIRLYIGQNIARFRMVSEEKKGD